MTHARLPFSVTLLTSHNLYSKLLGVADPEGRTALSDQKLPRPPLVLIANDQESSIRALESTLGPQGYAVLRAYNARQTIDHVSRAKPDVVIISEQLPDATGIDTC